jgi:hypothetical protein
MECRNYEIAEIFNVSYSSVSKQVSNIKLNLRKESKIKKHPKRFYSRRDTIFFPNKSVEVTPLSRVISELPNSLLILFFSLLCTPPGAPYLSLYATGHRAQR